MVWFLVINILIFIIELDILLGVNVYQYEWYPYYEYYDRGRINLKVWHIILLVVGNIWWLSAVTLIVLLVIWFEQDFVYYRKIKLKQGVTKKILDALNKSIINQKK